MKLIDQSYEIMTPVDGQQMLMDIEKAGRVCYKSEDAITEDSAKKFVKALIKHQHESVIEHKTITVRFTTDRGISHEIVRHRIASYSQESTRYCNYASGRFGNELTVILSDSLKQFDFVIDYLLQGELIYNELVNNCGIKPQDARDILPTCLKTEIVCTYNLREWRWFFIKRCEKDAHPKIRKLAIGLLNEFKQLIPVVFDDLVYEL